MRTLILLLAIGFMSHANAQTVTVQSGEHANFDRLVLTYPELKDWSLFREDDGYSLVVTKGNPSFDLTDVYRRISTNRLARIYNDPVAKTLRMVVECDCHAIPFELRKGILVIDILDGKPPEDSSFELAADGEIKPPLKAKMLHPPTSQPHQKKAREASNETRFSVSSVVITEAARLPPTATKIGQIETMPSLESAKEELLWQLSKGIASGAIDATKALNTPKPAQKSIQQRSNIHANGKLGIASDPTKRLADQMTGLGKDCIADERLAIADWGSNSAVAVSIAEKTKGLVGEFDRANPDAIAQSIRYYLSLGFGAEARLVLGAFNSSLPDRAIWETMSYIVDQEVSPGNVFSGMEVCDTSAAMWAALSSETMGPVNRVATRAILRTFSALPIHLRRQLGLSLADRFLQQNDAVTARAIGDAILRAPGEPDPSSKLLEAEIDLANGNPEAAQNQLSKLTGASGLIGIRSTVSLIEAQVHAGQEVPPDLIVSAESLLLEATGGEEEDLLKNALALGYASQNRFANAFDLFAPNSAEAVPLWKILGKHGNSASVLEWAVLPKDAAPPTVDAEVNQKIASRLLELGFPDQALSWLDPEEKDGTSPNEASLLLTAEVQILRNDNLAALSLLENLESETAKRLRAKALAALGSDNAILKLAQSGQSLEAANTAKQDRNWSELKDLETGATWREAATLATAKSTNEETAPQSAESDLINGLGKLAQTRAAIVESAAARKLLVQLLKENAF